jgi:glycosyltransferase involved in cell wall biosynthesis
LKKNRLNGHLFVMQRITPRFQDCRKWKTIFHPYWRMRPRYLNSLYRKMNGRFTLLTDSEILTEDYSHVYRHRIVTMPIPLEGFEPSELSETTSGRYNLQRDDRICFGFMGDSRISKGFHLLHEMIKKVFERDDEKIKFVIQCPNTEYEQIGSPQGLPQLEELTKQHGDRVVLVREKLSEEDYIRLYNFIDVGMLPYSHLSFREGTSNVFAESVALGKPVVVTQDTWMAHELKKYGGGLEFENSNVDDFAKKVLMLTDDYENFATKAKHYSATWREFHSVKNLVDMLLESSELRL